MAQLKISNFFTVAKKRQRAKAWAELEEPALEKRMKPACAANQVLPNEILGIILKFLTFKEAVELFGVVCKDWRAAWRTFISQVTDQFQLLSTAKFSGDDLILMIRSPNRQPHIQALADFFYNNDLASNASMKHFFRNCRIFTQLGSRNWNRSYCLLDTFRIKHSSPFGSLNLIRSESLVQICLQSRNSLRELCLENCVCFDSSLLHAITQCAGLEKVNLSYSGVDDHGVAMICRNNRQLQTLILQGVSGVTVQSMRAIAGARALRQLDISFSTLLAQNPGGFQLIRNLQLTHLILNGLDLTDAHISLLGPQPELVVLSLLNSSGLTDGTLRIISQNFGNLRMLNFKCQSGAASTSSGGFSELAFVEMLNHCSRIRVFECPGYLKTPAVSQILRERQDTQTDLS